jgi:hypothetical protein
VLISKMIFFKKKKIIGMYFDTKNYLKSNRNYTAKQTLNCVPKLSLNPCNWAASKTKGDLIRKFICCGPN